MLEDKKSLPCLLLAGERSGLEPCSFRNLFRLKSNAPLIRRLAASYGQLRFRVERPTQIRNARNVVMIAICVLVLLYQKGLKKRITTVRSYFYDYPKFELNW